MSSKHLGESRLDSPSTLPSTPLFLFFADSLIPQAEQERQAAVIRAEGEAEAAATISKALNRAGEAFVQFRRIEASKDIGELFFL
jgi:hypothetical protein